MAGRNRQRWRGRSTVTCVPSDGLSSATTKLASRLLAVRQGYPKGKHRSRVRDREVAVAGLKARGYSNREIGRRLGCDEKAVRKRLRRLGWKAPEAEQISLPLVAMEAPGADPNVSGLQILPVETPRDEMTSGADPNLFGSTSTSAPVDLPFTKDDDPADRRWDRLLAYLGLLDDAAPMFRDGDAVPHAGVLLVLPTLLATGVLDTAREAWGNIGPANSCPRVLHPIPAQGTSGG